MRTMTMKVDGKDTELGTVETRGAMHHVELTDAGRMAYLAHTPDTTLVTLHGTELQVRASFIRNAPGWKITGKGPGVIPDKPAPAKHPEPTPAPINTGDDGDDEEAGYAGWSKDELKDACEAAGVSKSGSKADLIERLEAQADDNEAVE